MRYHNITKDDMLNGDGLRVVLWVSGCTHKCKNCHNPVTWDIKGGLEFDEGAKKELFEALDKPYVSGITLSGGDPLHPANCRDITILVEEIKEKFPEKTIWMYTGFCWEEISTLEVIKNIDVLIDGPYIEELRDSKIHWRGSSNQRVIDVKQSLKEDRLILHCQ
ncbi:anaerobic ribonucleoside-triphosphate reductase activating protein [Anaerostipes sp.]|uniref:anaerobic ribonucleoside-triphosphate reductase activating protein n=1 Tax=Anaerostipes sp. TaxID=1872530 RepID=UPI00258F70D3|nr:anaerobic ribonucleoside-triphosphate reductase activating protein [Anaerostipes sp.]MCI5623467.1 anaerobic ribonucleoside-triphosphate reductase activating protein [Anaerostipes sp.]MDY2726461.1 anaerobic ribonucleoside-triphosphate reductase activating protein [Anaerostipes faecalis]